MGDIRRVGEWLWPASDTECQKVAHNMDSLKEAVGYCENFRVAIQAGGNVGIWAHALSGKFDAVYTAEPDPDNFSCLCANVPASNVIKLQCGFGKNAWPAALARIHGNCGATYVDGPGVIPIIEIDHLNLRDVDLLCLDIEGMEFKAIRGAFDTIRRSRPVILLEQKGLTERYGDSDDATTDLLKTLGYGAKTRIARDTIFTYRGK